MTQRDASNWKSASEKKRLSRLGLIQELGREAGESSRFSVNIGCKDTRFGDVNIDISGRPNVKGSALFLPFRGGTFSVAIFSEVLEHLPTGMEGQALREIHRVLNQNGILILSTPSSEGAWGKLYWLGDPTFWLINHRHYRENHLKKLLDYGGFVIEMISRRGGPRDLLFSIVTPFAYLSKKLGRPCDPNFNSDYSIESHGRGYTFVIQARKSDDSHQRFPAQGPDSVF